MARSSSTSRPFLHQRSDTGQFSYIRDLPAMIGPLVAGDVQRPWLGTAFCLTGKDIIKISLKTRDAETARQRWFDVHTQVEPLVQLAVVQARHKPDQASGTRDLKSVISLSEADLQVLVEQVRHDILADDDRSWVDPQYRNGTTEAVYRAAEGSLSMQAAAKRAREIETQTVHHALAMRDVGSLQMNLAEVDDSTSAKRLLVRIAAAAEKGEIPSQQDIAALSSLSVTQIRGGEFDERLADNGIRMPAGGMNRRLVALSMLRAAAQAHQEVDERLTGRHVVTPPRPGPLVVTESDIAHQSLGLSAVFDIWVKLKRPSAKTKGHNKLYMKRFIALHGDLPVVSVTREQVRAFRDLMERFPRNVPPALDGASPLDIAIWADANPTVRKISRTTVNSRAIGALSTLFDTAVREALIDSNPCQRLKLPLKASDRKEVVPFSISDLNIMFSAPEMTGTARYSKASGGQAARWLPLIGLFTGARMEEIAQLEVADVIKVDCFHALRITTESEVKQSAGNSTVEIKAKSLKNESAHRTVPIHDKLIECGLLDYVEQCRKAGHHRLFPQVVASGDRRAKNWSRWFARFLDKRVSTSASKNFHSFRHTFIDGMRDSLIGRDVIKAIVGHADANVTDGYGRGCSPRTMHAELKKLDFHGLIPLSS